jgi:hypothetical protein
MKIGRKEAILAFIAAVIPFVGRRANAQVQRLPPGTLTAPRTVAPQVSPEVADLQRRVAALEAQLAAQVAFTKDPNGDLRLRGTANIRIDAGMSFTCLAGNQMDLRASGSASVRGSTVALN